MLLVLLRAPKSIPKLPVLQRMRPNKQRLLSQIELHLSSNAPSKACPLVGQRGV